jgi:hypothetical protein
MPVSQSVIVQYVLYKLLSLVAQGEIVMMMMIVIVMMVMVVFRTVMYVRFVFIM